jgi:hypothetical protein
MLFSLFAFVDVLLSTSASWFAGGSGAGPIGAGDLSVTLQGPSTLALAAIGSATLAVYFVWRLRPPRGRGRGVAGRLSDQCVGRETAEAAVEQPTRGAA